jgi:outer membrane protein insertion porin family
VKFFFDIGILESESANANYNTSKGIFATGLEFPLGERARLGVNYKLDATKMSVSSTSTIGSVLTNEVGLGRLKNSSVGYSYEWDSRKTSLDNDEGLRFLISQDFGGLGGDDSFVKSKAKLIAQRRFFNDEITLRATLAGGAVSFSGAGSRATDRWLFDEDIMRGFAADGIGPRELNGSTVNDALGGNYFATAKFEALFPLGLPEEYGITGGVFYDIGNVWGLDKISSVPADTFYESGSFRHVAGVSIFWETPIGPMRLNWSKALKKEDHDIDQNFEFTISTEF